jgi:hypothetical protein
MVFTKTTLAGQAPPAEFHFAHIVPDWPQGEVAYDPDMAKKLAAVSAWSYSDLETFQNKLSIDLGYPRGDYVEISVKNDAMLVQATAQVIRSYDKKTAIVCFRGTELVNVVNWLTDVTVRKENFHEYYVHSGFLRNLKEVWDGPKGILAHLLQPAKMPSTYTDYTVDPVDLEHDALEAIYITGHSLGGAMAGLAALDLNKNERYAALWGKLKGAYTYGQPMFSGCEKRDELQGLMGGVLFRHVYQNDIVPHLPPLSVGLFDHVGSERRNYSGEMNDDAWILRQGGPLGLIDKGRVTQVPSVLLSSPLLALDAVLQQVSWVYVPMNVMNKFLPFLKVWWSMLDHLPIWYMGKWSDVEEVY